MGCTITFDDWDAFGEAAEAYARAFGESPPLIEMPADPADQLALIRAAVADGKPYQTDIPSEADI
jgi:hypothetical protein